MAASGNQELDGSAAGVSRRALFAGAAGAALLAGGVASPATADAAPAGGDGVAPAAVQPDGQPGPTSIGSAPRSGYVYRSACMYDFRPFDPAGQPTWGGSGVYTAGVSTPLRATFEVPAGALLKDVEWYVYNTGVPVSASLYQYTPGSGLIWNLTADTSIPSSAQTAAYRTAIPAADAGPYSVGSRLLASLSTPTDGSVQINGVRLGFTQAAATTGLLPAPVRAYDSRVTGGPVVAGTTRTVTLPSSVVVPGVTGVLVNITATGATADGYLKVYPGNASAPAASALNFQEKSIANAIVVGVSSSRQIKIYASRTVHVIVDITGTLS